jgi:hypothetical protein
VTNQRWNNGKDRYRPAGEVIQTSHYEVALIPDDKTAKAFVCQHHYSGSYVAARRRVGLYHKSDLVGVAVFSQPISNKALAIFGSHAENSIELGRFVLLDSVPGNGESWFLARCFELLRSEFHGILSFSDPSQRTNQHGEVVFGGHLGTIYQAHNARYLGRSTARTLRLLPNGAVLSDRSLQKIRARERGWEYSVAQLVQHGADAPSSDLRGWLKHWLPLLTRTQRHHGNHRYAWELSPQRLWSLPTQTQPYPKKVKAV